MPNNKFKLAVGVVALGALLQSAHAQELRYNPSVYVVGEGGFFNPDNRFGTNARPASMPGSSSARRSISGSTCGSAAATRGPTTRTPVTSRRSAASTACSS